MNITNLVFVRAGMGIAYLPSLACVALYFEKYRNLAIGIAVSGLGVGTFIYPPIITALSHTYSWKGSMLVIGALTLNICVCGCVIRPIRRQEFRREKTPLFDLSVFTNVGYVLLVGINFLICFALSAVYLQLAAFAETGGIYEDQAAMLMSVIGIANVVGRLVVGAIGNHPKVNVFIIYSAFHVICGTVASFYPVFVRSYPAMIVLSVLFGFFTASYGALLPALMIEIVGLRRLESGYGFLLPFSGIGQLIGGPFSGFVFDMSGSYDISFYVGGVCLVMSGVSAFFLACLERNKPIEAPAECAIIEELKPLPA